MAGGLAELRGLAGLRGPSGGVLTTTYYLLTYLLTAYLSLEEHSRKVKIRTIYNLTTQKIQEIIHRYIYIVVLSYKSPPPTMGKIAGSPSTYAESVYTHITHIPR